MAVIYLNQHRHLTSKQKELAKTALSNEINGVMADLKIVEEGLGKTSAFGGMNLRHIAIEYINNLIYNPDGSFNEELLRRVYKHYFSE